MRTKHDLAQPALVKEALTTKGYAYEQQLDYDNQRLEFLGDAVMELIVSDHLFSQTELSEGQLTRLRSSAVDEASFSKLALRFKLDQDLRLATGQRLTPSLLADAFEAFIGAYYLANGFEATKAFVVESIMPLIDLSGERDPKSRLQEMLQAKGITDIKYHTLAQTGPDHDCRFEVALHIAGTEVSRGRGRSKKEAQKAAAADYLNVL
ncbi:MAG TPA: ribonuclease III [Tissierellia bacterium]|nr:ribonuclease III [Tissierellia bacterium]